MSEPQTLKPLMLFHVLEHEAETAFKAVHARGIRSPKEMSDEFDAALKEELDKIIPGACLVERSKTELISIAVMAKGAGLPDSRFQKDPRRAPSVRQVDELPPDPPAGMGVLAVRVAPTAAVKKKLDEVVSWEPLPAHQVEQMKHAAEDHRLSHPYPTHQGTICLDGKAEIKVYQLSDGQRVVDAYDLQRFFMSFGGI